MALFLFNNLQGHAISRKEKLSPQLPRGAVCSFHDCYVISLVRLVLSDQKSLFALFTKRSLSLLQKLKIQSFAFDIDGSNFEGCMWWLFHDRTSFSLTL